MKSGFSCPFFRQDAYVVQDSLSVIRAAQIGSPSGDVLFQDCNLWSFGLRALKSWKFASDMKQHVLSGEPHSSWNSPS